MNGGFYILPNEEGYLVKSYDTNSEIALFRSRRDAEVFISSLTLAPPSSVPSAPNGYPSGPVGPQYSVQQPQQIITPYPTSGASPQVFFIQQPAPAQQVVQPSYPFYPMMSSNPSMGGACQGMYPGMYPGYYGLQNNNYGGGCSCGYNNPHYNEHFDKNMQPNYRNDSQYDLSTNNNRWKEEHSNVTQGNNNYPPNRMEEQLVQSPVQEYNSSNPRQNENEFFGESLGEQQYNNVMAQPEGPIQSDFQQEQLAQQGNYEEISNNEPYYEQAFVSDPVFVNQQEEQFGQSQERPKPINLADDEEFFNYVNEQDFNHNTRISKNETKRLMKEQLKAEKRQAKLEKQNRKKTKRKGALDIEDLPPIVE